MKFAYFRLIKIKVNCNGVCVLFLIITPRQNASIYIFIKHKLISDDTVVKVKME